MVNKWLLETGTVRSGVIASAALQQVLLQLERLIPVGHEANAYFLLEKAKQEMRTELGAELGTPIKV